MKKTFKKVIAVFMIVIMVAAYLPMTENDTMFGVEASAIVTNGKVKLGDNINWTYDSKSRTITVSGSGAMYNYSNGDNGQRWDELVLGLTHYPNKDARNVVISNGITSIGNNVFNGLSGITSVSIPASVTSIGESAFKNCTSLSSVSIPASVKTIGKSAFEGCSKLSSVTLNNGLTTIGESAFKNTKYASVSLPSTVTSIGTSAFAGISNLVFTCNYNDFVHNYCKTNSYKFKFNTPGSLLVIESDLNTEDMTVNVRLKVVSDSTVVSAVNAGNFTLTYNDSVFVVAPDAGYEYTANAGVSKAVVYGENAVSIAVMAESASSYTTVGYETSYTIAEFEFKVNGQADTADFTFTADTLMLNGSKRSATAANVNMNLHSYDTVTVAKTANCHEKGSMYYTCTLCGKEVYEEIAINPTVHDGGTELKNELAETCGTNGYTGDTCCKGCGDVINSGNDIAATGNHEYSVSVTKTATCSENGEKTFVCSVCGNTYTESVSIDASNHVGETEVKNVKDVTCSEDGYTGDTYCKSCNTMIQSGSVIKSAGEHSYTSKVITQATCTSAGKTEYTCTVCGDSYTETVESGHEYVAVVTAPTCTSAGYTVYTCSVCEASYRGDNVASLGHEYNENGECVRCGEVKITEISFGDSVSVTVNNDEKTVVSKLNSLKASEFISMVEGEGWTVCGEDGNVLADDTLVSTGCKIKHSSGAVEYTLIILGDVNSDGKVTAADARLVLRKSAQLQELTDLQTLASDVDINEKVTASDARIILRVSAQMQQF